MKKITALIIAICLAFCSLIVSAETGNANGVENEIPEISIETYEYFHDELLQCKTAIDVSDFDINLSNVGAFYQNLKDYYYDLFHVENVGCSYYPTSGEVVAILPVYNIDSEDDIIFEYNRKLKLVNSKIDEIISGIQPGWSELEKVLYVHNYLVTNYEYDESKTIFDAYNFFMQNKGVCQAYALAFNGIMHNLGITSTLAINRLENHAWNIVTINGKNYHIDCTQDDPVGQSAGSVSYKFFLLSDNSIRTIDDHRQWYSVLYNAQCTDSEYESSYAWNEAKSGITWANGSYYYIKYQENGMSELFETRTFNDKYSKHENINTVFYVPDGSGRYYDNYYGGITSVGTNVYYSSPSSVYCYDTITNQVTTVKSSTESISSCRYDGNGVLSIFKSNIPNDYDAAGCEQKVLINKMGDIDGNGIINSIELARFQQCLLNGEYDYNYAITDFNGNNRPDLIDLIKMKRLQTN